MKRIWNASFSIRLVYALCLAGATYNHARIVAEHGLTWDYGGLPFWVSSFWTALTFIDALAVILLLASPLRGMVLTAGIILVDVAVNCWVGLVYGFDVASFVAQVLFLIFVAVTLPIAWRSHS